MIYFIDTCMASAQALFAPWNAQELDSLTQTRESDLFQRVSTGITSVVVGINKEYKESYSGRGRGMSGMRRGTGNRQTFNSYVKTENIWYCWKYQRN